MPLTKDKYLVKEDEDEVKWERITREFLRNLTPRHRHRISAVMIYEWATGKKPDRTNTAVFKKLNRILEFYFGPPFQTWIANKKVGRCYEVRAGYYIRNHRPRSIELWVEYQNKTLYP